MTATGDVGRWHADPATGAAWVVVPFEDDPNLTHVARTAHPRTPWGARNGLPETSLYTYRPGEAAREAEVAAFAAAARRRAQAAFDAERARLAETWEQSS